MTLALCENKYEVNDTWKVKSKRLDVVFVVHEVPEMKKYSKYMEKLFRSLEIFVSKHRKMKTRFGLVGFGGDCIHSDAHFHTLNGQLKGRIDDLRQGLKFLNYTKRTNDDTIAALRFAMQYPFNSDHKAIVLLTDSEPMKSLDLTALSEDLHYSGVLLNVIKPPQQLEQSPIAFEGTVIDNKDMLLTDTYSHFIKRGYVWNANYVTSDFASFHKSFLKYFDYDLKTLQTKCFNCQCQVGLAQLGQTSCRLC